MIDKRLRLTEVTLDAEVSLPPEVNERSLFSLVEHVLVCEHSEGAWSIAFQFTSDSEMQRMHQEFMGLDSPTDIMTFPYAEDDWSEAGLPLGAGERGGDVVISVDRAEDQAGEEGWGLADELFFLVCHGMLHLLDWDDATDTDRAAMLDRQRDLLRSWRASS